MPRISTWMLALALALLAVPRLEGDEVVVASARGEITVNGQPLVAGKITFYLDDDQFVGAKVKNGTYKVTRVPLGEWKVGIEGEGIPARFAGGKEPIFTVKITPNENTFDFDMKR